MAEENQLLNSAELVAFLSLLQPVPYQVRVCYLLNLAELGWVSR